MKLSNKLAFAVMFARCSRDYRIDPLDLAELIQLSNRAFAAAERETSRPNYSADKERNRVEAKAKLLCLTVQWAGLGPTFYRKGFVVSIPWSYA